MSFALSILASIIAGIIILPSTVRFLSNASSNLLGDFPKIEGDWEVEFTEHDGSDKKIELTIERFGKSVKGSGHIVGNSVDPFIFRAVLKRQVLVGNFRRSRSVLAGTGSFLLKISADEKSMCGHCCWYENNIENICSSNYKWTKKEKK